MGPGGAVTMDTEYRGLISFTFRGSSLYQALLSSQAVEGSCGVFKFGRAQDKVCIKALVIKFKLIPFTWPPH